MSRSIGFLVGFALLNPLVFAQSGTYTPEECVRSIRGNCYGESVSCGSYGCEDNGYGEMYCADNGVFSEAYEIAIGGWEHYWFEPVSEEHPLGFTEFNWTVADCGWSRPCIQKCTWASYANPPEYRCGGDTGAEMNPWLGMDYNATVHHCLWDEEYPSEGG